MDITNILALTWALRAAFFRKRVGEEYCFKKRVERVGDNILGAFISSLVASGPVRSDHSQASP